MTHLFRIPCYTALGIAGCLMAASMSASANPPLVPYAISFESGSAAEQPMLLQNSGSTIVNNARMADVGQFWAYGFPVNPGEGCLLVLKMDASTKAGLPNVSVPMQGGTPLPLRIRQLENGDVEIGWVVPDSWPIGGRMAVVLGAKTDPLRVLSAVFMVKQTDKEVTGVPDAVVQLMTRGVPGAKVSAPKPASRPYTSLQTPRNPDPTLDIPTDALFVYSSAADAIQGWKVRGFNVWTMGGSRTDKAYADKHADELQLRSDGTPRAIGDNSFYLTPTANRNIIEQGYYQQAISAGSEGICPEEPEFWADAGWSQAFKQAWKERYHTNWQPPNTDINSWWQSAKLMGALETEHVDSVLKAADGKPNVRKMVALHSPLNYAQWSIIAPQYSITSLQGIQDVVGQVWTGTARTPVRYAGNRSDRAFSLAYLEYSSLYQLLRGTGKRLWFLMDPLEDDPTRAQADYKSHYEQTLTAAMLFPDVDSYEVMPWPDRIYGHVPADYATEINSVVAALQEMHDQKTVEGNPATGATIGVFVSDSMQYQRSGPSSSDFDGVFGLMLPLLERGVPVQAVSLDRAGEPGYLKQFKTLILSYDFQKPATEQVQAGIADWVRRGGTLVYAGGTDAYNALADSWWAKLNFKRPQDELWTKLGIHAGTEVHTVSAPAEDRSGYTRISGTDGSEHNLGNRRHITLDLTRFCQTTGSVAVHFSDATPRDAWGPYLASTELRVNGVLAASFSAGSDIENRFIVYDNGSEFDGRGRYADKDASWTYQFDNLPAGAKIEMTVDIGNGYDISAAAAEPIFGHTLIAAESSPVLKKAYPRLRISSSYPATIYTAAPARVDPAELVRPVAINPGPPLPLYTLRSGGTPVWMRAVGDGLAINIGVAPGFFSTSSRSAGLLRALVQYGQQRAGGVYKEPRSLRLRRGRYTIIHTFQGREEVDGRTIDLLSPTLNVAEDRIILPNSQALLYDLGDEDEPPHIGFVSGRVDARLETVTTTSFFARGALHTTGVARIHSGGHPLAGAKAMDRLGRPVEVQAQAEGNTVLVRYPNDPDGVLIRLGWKQ